MYQLAKARITGCALVLSLLLTACGGAGDSGGSGGGAANLVPTANAGASRTVDVGSVTLNGTASSDPDGTIASYSWTQTAGSPVTLSAASTSQPTFIAPQSTVSASFSFQLVVTDNRGATSSASAVTITVNGNAVPVANAGAPQTVASGATVTLNGSGSSDADGLVTSYSWTQTGGAATTLSAASGAFPNFAAPMGVAASTLTFQLVVTDNRGAVSAPATVTIAVNANLPPVANAGTPQTVQAGAAVSLNGNASSDPDGQIASYSWTQTAGSAVTLINANTAAPGFAAPIGSADSTLSFQLIVTDNLGAVSAASSVTITASRNQVPIALAGTAQTVAVGGAVTLSGSSSFDSGGSIAGYAWTQTSGPAVVLSGASTVRPTFTAPGTPSTLVFTLVVTDNLGAVSSTDPATARVTITVNAGVTMSGTIRFQRVPFVTGSPYGLDYANAYWLPARGLTVNATMIGGAVVVGTAVTDASGKYSMTVPANLSINVRAVAQMLRTSAQPLPRWNMRVQDSGTGNVPYNYFNGVVNSNAGTHNIDIPSGIAANGIRTQGRDASSGPYAILDTIYTAMQKVLSVAPTADFPELFVNWGGQSEGVFFDTVGGQHIALLGDASEDADEYDQYVIAHEFGHYIEENFSRSDSIGGSHGLGDKVDMRLAFSEGFGDAFAAIVLNDPLARDSYVFNGVQRASIHDIEINPSISAGCWCSETSVSSMLWDLYDNVPDGNDNISLPFSALWDVLANQQRVTPAITSIFSFLAALKAAQPAFAGPINVLGAGQNINTGAVDAFATMETFLPFANMTLPLFTSIARGGGPVVVRSIDDGGRYNKAGNRSFLRFTPAASGVVTLSVSTSNVASTRDPDFVVRNNGVVVAAGLNGPTEYPETETFSVVAGQTYIIDAYECANGCSTAQGTPGDYNLTVTIN